MNLRIALLSIIALATGISPVIAGGKKENKASITFHIETESTDNPKMIFPQLTNGETRYFRRMPEITTKDVVSFAPFPSELGDDYGVVLKLKPAAVNRFAAVTNFNQGRWLVAQVNGRVVDGVMIDKTVNDGFVVIWKGITLADLAIFDAQMSRTGEPEKKKKFFQ